MARCRCGAGGPRGRSQQQLGDGGRAQRQAEAQRRLLGLDLGEVAGDRQVDGGDEVLPGAVVVDAVAQREAFARPAR